MASGRSGGIVGCDLTGPPRPATRASRDDVGCRSGASGCRVSEVFAALFDLERVGPIAHSELFGAGQSTQARSRAAGFSTPFCVRGSSTNRAKRPHRGLRRRPAADRRCGPGRIPGGHEERSEVGGAATARPPGASRRLRAKRAFHAFATARRAITPIRCARYSALAWMSLFSPSAGVSMPAIASGEKFAAQRLLHRGVAEHAALARAGHRHAHAGRRLRHEHADDGIARGRIAELLVGRLLPAPGTRPR